MKFNTAISWDKFGVDGSRRPDYYPVVHNYSQISAAPCDECEFQQTCNNEACEAFRFYVSKRASKEIEAARRQPIAEGAE